MTDSSEDLLRGENIRSGYGPIEVLKGLSFHVKRGEIVTIIGANGAGKTTLLGAISGINPATSGSIIFNKESIANVPAHKLVTLGLSHVPEGRKIFPKLTVLENLDMGAYTKTDRREIIAAQEEMFELFPVLKERRVQSGGTLSGGEQQMLAIARALMSRPRMLLMDEPSMGISPKLVTRIFSAIETLNKQGMTILLVEQNAHLALEIADRGYVMETGEITIEDSSQNLSANPKVQQAYLGG